MTPRTLIAGFGNVLRGDDGFGLAVLEQLASHSFDASIELMDVGTGGIRLAQELLGGYDRLIIIDAMTEGGVPGTLYVRKVDDIAPAREIDMHLAIPSRALMVARSLDALPRMIYMVGCEPREVDELMGAMSAEVKAAVPVAVNAILQLLDKAVAPTVEAASEADAAQDAGTSIQRMDEVLELLFWMEGEGFAGGSTTLEGMVRFLSQPEADVRAAISQLASRGDITMVEHGEYRLTTVGRKEASRRFAEEFAPMLAQGHGECSDPNCDCQTEGPAACQANHNHGSH